MIRPLTKATLIHCSPELVKIASKKLGKTVKKDYNKKQKEKLQKVDPFYFRIRA